MKTLLLSHRLVIGGSGGAICPIASPEIAAIPQIVIVIRIPTPRFARSSPARTQQINNLSGRESSAHSICFVTKRAPSFPTVFRYLVPRVVMLAIVAHAIQVVGQHVAILRT